MLALNLAPLRTNDHDRPHPSSPAHTPHLTLTPLRLLLLLDVQLCVLPQVQIAYRKPNNEVQVDLLHSKLVTRRWPSKSVMEKRLRAFVSQCRVPTTGTFVTSSVTSGLLLPSAVD